MTGAGANATSVGAIWLGRDRELGELEAGLAALATGRGGLYLVAGEPGIGKTRLCDELARSAAGRGIAVHWGRAWEAGGAPSYWPFIQILRSVARPLDGALLGTLVGAHGPELTSLLPELRKRLPELAEVPATHGERFELFDAVGAFLHGVADRTPLVLVVDDLHAADPSTIRLLHFLVRDLRDRPLMIVGTYREAEARMLLEIGRTLAQVAREAVVLPLRRLGRAEVAQFAARALGAAPGEERVDALFQRTEGNPLFLRELLQLQGSALRPPDGIREVVRARLSLLTPELRRILEVAAILGRELDLDVLASVAGLASGDAAALLAPAVDAGIVEPLDGDDRWRFTHVMLREGLYDDLAVDARGELHARVAEELRRRDGDPSELAHHLMRAIPVVPLAQAIDAALRAGERSMRLLAFEDATMMLGRATKLLEAVPEEARRLFEVTLALGIARIRSIDVVEGRETCVRAAELARRLGDGELFARAVLGATCEFDPGKRDHVLIALLDEALAMLPEGDGALRAVCMAQLAAERQPEPDTGPPLALARDAVAMARRVGDSETLRHTISNAGLAMMSVSDPRERLELYAESLRLAQHAGDSVSEMRLHLFLSAAHSELGDLDGGDLHTQAYVTLSVARKNKRTQLISRSLTGAAALWRGDVALATQCCNDADEIARLDPSARDGIGMLAFALGLRRASEDYSNLPELEAELRTRLRALHGGLGACFAELVICQLYASAGDRERTRAQLDRVRAHPAFADVRVASWLALLVDAIHLEGDRALAELVYPILLPRASWFFGLGPVGCYTEPPYHRQLGLLAQVLGRHAAAVDHLAEAAAGTERAGMVLHVARVRYQLAAALLARDGDGDRARATELLDAARAHAHAYGQAHLVALIEARRAGIDAAPEAAVVAPPAPSGGGELAFTLGREGEYWTVTAASGVVRLRDSRGLHVLAQLVGTPGHELHVLQLISPGDDERDAGDAGEALDAKAVHSYRARLLELREELDEAEQFGDAGRTERARAEIEALTDELARAVGLGGRARRTGGAAERARTTIQKRLRDAIRRIEEGLPDVGLHLDQTIRTGMFCGYFPAGRKR